MARESVYTMRRIGMVSVCLLCAVAAYGAREAKQELQPLPAAEAERRVAETRDFLTDLLWLNTEGHWHEGRWEECIRLCRQIIALDPHFLEAYNGAAWMLWNLDRDEEAVAVYQGGIAANPGRYEIHHDFGMYYYHRRQYDKAVEQFRESVASQAPQYFQHMLPNVLERAGRKREALAEWRALLGRFPDDPVAKPHIESLERELAEEENPAR